jgi:toxin YoeB
MKIHFDKGAIKEYQFWTKNNFSIIEKIHELIIDIGKHPYEGIGKPEGLKGNLSGYWSRRITDEHRLVYKIEGDNIYIISCRFHYV